MDRCADGRVFLSDEPIESANQDRFEHQEYVDALEQTIERRATMENAERAVQDRIVAARTTGSV